MFGQPQWFKTKGLGWGIYPASWQGWTWLGTWAAVVFLPFLGFYSQRDMFLESVIWFGTTLAVMFMDVWQILRALNPPAPKPSRPAPSPPPVPATAPTGDDGIVFVGEAQNRSVGTRNYDFRVRKS